MRLGRILLGLDDEPSGVSGVAQLAQGRLEIDRAISRHREYAIEDSREETSVVAQDVGEHGSADVLAMHVHDSRAVAASNHSGIAAGKHQMSRIEQQSHIVA